MPTEDRAKRTRQKQQYAENCENKKKMKSRQTYAANSEIHKETVKNARLCVSYKKGRKSVVS